MEERPIFGFSLAFFFAISFGIISCGLCIASELHKTKIKDIKLDGELCSLPGSHSFRLGIAGLVCFFIAQIIGICLFITWKFLKDSSLGDVGNGGGGWNWKAVKPTLSTVFLSFSWISFGIAVMLLATATSMSRRQDNGQGWIDGECYIVKDGVFGGSGILVLISVTSTLVPCILTMKKTRVEHEGKKVNAQVV